MFSKNIMRCIASLCLCVVLAGVFSPAKAYASESQSSYSLEWNGNNCHVTLAGTGDILTICKSDSNINDDKKLAYFQHIASTIGVNDGSSANNLQALLDAYTNSTSTGASGESWELLPLRMAIALCTIYYIDLTGQVSGDDATDLSALNSALQANHQAFNDFEFSNGKRYRTTDSNLGILNFLNKEMIPEVTANVPHEGTPNYYMLEALGVVSECVRMYSALPSHVESLDDGSHEYALMLSVAKQMINVFSASEYDDYNISIFNEIFEDECIRVSAILGTKSSMEKLYENLDTNGDLDLDDVINNSGAYVDYVSNYVEGASPIDLFYTINIPKSASIFVDYNRDSILNDIPVDTTLDNLLYSTLERWEQNKKQFGDSDNVWRDTLANSGSEIYRRVDVAVQLMNYQKFISGENNQLDVTGNGTGFGHNSAVSAKAVSMSEYIVEGMGYSATYIPMKTNLYSPDVISSYSEEYRDDFFYKYGFNRKVIFIDTSASSAVDFYTSGGKSSPTTRVATLRDLLESDGKDITLFVDSGLYNADDVINEGNAYLSSRYGTLSNLRNDLKDYIEVEQAINVSKAEEFTVTMVNGLLKLGDLIFGIDTSDETEQLDALEELRENWDNDIYPSYCDNFMSKYHVDIDADDFDIEEVYAALDSYLTLQSATVIDKSFLKDDETTSYKVSVKTALSDTAAYEYRDIYNTDDVMEQQSSNSSGWFKGNGFLPRKVNEGYLTENNYDAIVMDSHSIGKYMSRDAITSKLVTNEEGDLERIYSVGLSDYDPMQNLAFISLLYRDFDAMGLSELVSRNQPIFMASDDLCSIDDAQQWYRNSLLNFALVNNLNSMIQIDYNYACDIDAPLYLDICGNILTESGTVVIPAASNATLHTGAYKFSNLAVGLYSVYGKDYSVPIDLPGAYSVLSPYFMADFESGVYLISGLELNLNGEVLKLNHINQYSKDTVNVVQTVYKQAMREGSTTNYNWPAMVHVVNEVLRGAPIEFIDKGEENIVVATGASKSTIIAAIKLEGLIDSLQGEMSNTLMCIPDFTRNENTEYWVALLVKVMLVLVTGVVIVAIYRDGVSGKLGIRTLVTCVSSVVLTFLCIVIVPAIFQLTYYSANKLLLEDEAFRILLVNTEKYNLGTEIAMTGTREPSSSDEFSLQLDWIDVPWYEEINELIFNSGLSEVQTTRLEAYQNSPLYYNNDVDIYSDGVYITTQSLFESASIDFTSNGVQQGLYIHADQNADQTASFYSPYYAFLRVLVANINEYNKGRNYVNSADGTTSIGDSDYTYTTKYMAGNKLKTVGICEAYFTSEDFMSRDTDIMHLYQIYRSTDTTGSIVKDKHMLLNQHFDRPLLFSDKDAEAFKASIWYNDMGDAGHLDDRVAIIDQFARDYISDNKDMLSRVSDETFIKVMALYMSVKYNQVFGVTHANALEIYNLDSNDLLRLCLTTPEQAALTSPMSYSRYISTFGGEASVYAAAVLTVIMYVGSFIKPLCTVVVYISVFMSIFVFKVVLRKPSANLWGYFVTCMLLCATNFLHAVLLKISVNLPSTGLSMLGCLIFMIVGQVGYLLVLAYVTGVACKDWSNLGMNEYAKEAANLQRRFDKSIDSDRLSGRISHHENNWDYYNDLISQHRSRNTT